MQSLNRNSTARSTLCCLVKSAVAASLVMVLSGCAHQMLEARGAGGPAVRFSFEAPQAKEVSIVADFTGWRPISMKRTGGTWSFEIPLPPGRYVYGFLVDRRSWEPDPWATLLDEDSFGKRNSVLVVE